MSIWDRDGSSPANLDDRFYCRTRRKKQIFEKCLDGYMNANARENRKSACWRCLQGRRNRQNWCSSSEFEGGTMAVASTVSVRPVKNEGEEIMKASVSSEPGRILGLLRVIYQVGADFSDNKYRAPAAMVFAKIREDVPELAQADDDGLCKQLRALSFSGYLYCNDDGEDDDWYKVSIKALSKFSKKALEKGMKTQSLKPETGDDTAVSDEETATGEGSDVVMDGEDDSADTDADAGAAVDAENSPPSRATGFNDNGNMDGKQVLNLSASLLDHLKHGWDQTPGDTPEEKMACIVNSGDLPAHRFDYGSENSCRTMIFYGPGVKSGVMKRVGEGKFQFALNPHDCQAGNGGAASAGSPEQRLGGSRRRMSLRPRITKADVPQKQPTAPLPPSSVKSVLGPKADPVIVACLKVALQIISMMDIAPSDKREVTLSVFTAFSRLNPTEQASVLIAVNSMIKATATT